MLVISSSFPSLWGKLIWKMFLVVIFEILELFVNTLTLVDKDPLQNCEIFSHKYPLRNCKSLLFPIQMQLSVKRKVFFNFLFHYRNLHHVLKILKKKVIAITHVFYRYAKSWGTLLTHILPNGRTSSVYGPTWLTFSFYRILKNEENY